MSELDKYLKYLEKLKKEDLVNNDKKCKYELMIAKCENLLENITNNIDQVQEDEFRKIFANVDSDNVSKMILEFRNIKIFNKFFNNPRFEQEPQIIIAKKRLEKIIDQLQNYLKAVRERISEIKLIDVEYVQKQIELVKRIKKQEVLSFEELEQFYHNLMKCQNKEIDINQIIMDVSSYLNNLLTEQLNAVKKGNESKRKVVDSSPVNVLVKIKKNNLTEKEIEMIKVYQKRINDVCELGKKHYFNSLRDILVCYQDNIEIPLIFIDEVREKIGIELNYENVKLLDKFNDILNLSDDGDVATLQDEDLIEDLRELLKEFKIIFKNVEVMTDEQNELLNILDNPQSLVVFLNDESDSLAYVEKDFEKEMRNGDRRYTIIAVKNIIKQLYGNNVFPNNDGEAKKYCGNSRIYHVTAGREFRCFYIELSVSSEVKEYLCETYGISKNNMKSFRVYLYTGFVNIENHGADYCDEQYNRCNKSLNVAQVERLNRLFSKTKLTSDDKIMISSFIETGFDITKKLNRIERKKRYE